ncbi:glycosyltransferase family 4 protein, partial [bacterium]|nr:glycosyltransferase family 4 protein [bacterium]
MEKILFVCNTAGILARFRLPVLKAAREAGYEVSCICGLGINVEEYIETLNDVGFSVRWLPGLEENGLSLRTLIEQAFELSKMIRDNAPDILHSFTHRANIVSFLALQGNRSIRFIPNVTGAGRLFGENLSFRDRMLRWLLLNLYRCFEPRCECIYFQNSDDLQEMGRTMGWPHSKLKLTNGSGLDPLEVVLSNKTDVITKRNELYRIYGIDPYKQLFIMPSRALHSKGVAEFYNAAERYLELFNDAVFVHAGEAVEDSTDGLSQSMLRSMQLSGLYYIGFQSDIYSLIDASDIVVLP